MKNTTTKAAGDVRKTLIELGGKLSQDLGVGRMMGQIVVHLYLYDGDCSQDAIAHELGLSKASVSIATRQLENLGAIRRTWRKGDRKVYYRSADNIATALQQGLIAFIGQRIQAMASELDRAHAALDEEHKDGEDTEDSRFVFSRVKRAKQLRDRAAGLLNSPILKFFMKS